jgi:DMSO/TMAO reductase YedYZ molybdopterin-dependent catalytic subunit
VKKKIFLMLLLVITLGFVTSGSIIAAQGASEIEIDGSVSHPGTLTVNELMAMPRSTVHADLYCYGQLVTSGDWAGVSLRYLLENVGFDEKAKSVEFYADDGYTIDLSITEAMREDVIIAYEIDGQLLPETLRLVLPEENGAWWIAMINHITVSANAPLPDQSATSIFTNPQPVPQQSPTPQVTPTPQPQPTLSPSPTPSLVTQTTNPNPEPFPIIWTVTAVATLAVAGTVFTVYRKKRNH